MSGELNPITREEMFLAKAAGRNVDPPTPITRKERFLQAIIASRNTDWNQNDPSQPDYVKNRTHYEEITEESIEGRVYDIPTYLQHDSAYVHNLHIPLQLGQAWTIEPAESYLGNTETCEVEQADDETPCLRWKNDLVTLTADSIVVGGWGDSQYLTGLKITCVSGTVTTKIVKTIDPKYIKDMYYEEVVEESIEGLEYADIPASVTVTQHNLNIPLQVGQIWDSTPNTSSAYNGLEVQQADDGTVYIGDYPNCSSVPYYITANEIKCSQSWINMIGASRVSIVCVSGTILSKTVHKIPSKYLPDTINCVDEYDLDITFTSDAEDNKSYTLHHIADYATLKAKIRNRERMRIRASAESTDTELAEPLIMETIFDNAVYVAHGTPDGSVWTVVFTGFFEFAGGSFTLAISQDNTLAALIFDGTPLVETTASE